MEELVAGFRRSVVVVDQLPVAWLSKEYSEFLKANPAAGKMLALGSGATFLWAGQLIKIECR